MTEDLSEGGRELPSPKVIPVVFANVAELTDKQLAEIWVARWCPGCGNLKRGERWLCLPCAIDLPRDLGTPLLEAERSATLEQLTPCLAMLHRWNYSLVQPAGTVILADRSRR